MHSVNPTAPPFSLASIKLGISPSECECDDCKKRLLKSIVFGHMPNDYLCTAGSSECLVDNPEPANSCVGEPEAEVYRYPFYRKSARSMSVTTLSTISEEDEDVSSSEEQDSSESSGEVSSLGMFKPNFASHCPGEFMHEVPSWSPETCYSDPTYNSQAEENSFHHQHSQPCGPYDIPHDEFELYAPEYCQPKQFNHADFPDMPDVHCDQPMQFTHTHYEDMSLRQYYQPERFTRPHFEGSSMPNHDFSTPFQPYYKFDYAQYNSHSAQNQYPFPVQGPAQFILDHSMFGEKTTGVSSEAAPVANVPAEYVGCRVDEGGDWVWVRRDLES